MFQITTDLSSLSRVQREAFADFVVNFPQQNDDDVPVTFSGLVDQSPEDAFAPAEQPVSDRLDKSGLPWDERIHASSRVKTSDGCWRKRRGIDDATVAKVEADLKALMAIPAAATVAVQTPAPPSAIALVPPPPAAGAPVAVPAPPAPPAAVDDKAAFVALITLASNAIGAKTLTQEQLTAAVVAAGVPSLPLLGNRLDLVPQVKLAIESYIASAA